MFLQILATHLFPTLILCLNQEGLYLHNVKLRFDDTDYVLSNWNNHDDTPCSWFGITCDQNTLSDTSLDLSNANVAWQQLYFILVILKLNVASITALSAEETLLHFIVQRLN